MSPENDNYRILIEAIKERNSESVREILFKDCSLPCCDAIFLLIQNSESHPICASGCKCSSQEKDILYMLIDYGFNIEDADERGNTCLFYAVKNNHSVLCETLLQCGADMWARTEFQISVLEYALQTSSTPIKDIFDKYYPGVWKAVEWENIYQVRKLVNLWCKTDLKKDDEVLKNVALKTGHEEIISLILGIFETMKLIHHILAKNIKAVSQLLESNHQKLRLDLRKMSDKGAPILYYLIKSADVEAIELFIKYGCHLYTIMQDDLGFDMPVLFSALKSDAPLKVIEALLPPGKAHQEDMMFRILYKGQTLLEVALLEKVPVDVFRILIDRGGPLLLAERNQMNQTVRDLAASSGETCYVEVIDDVVELWILHPNEYPQRRQKLALYGWDLDAVCEMHRDELDIKHYFHYAENLQNGVKALSVVAEKGDVEKYLLHKATLSAFELPEKFLWEAKAIRDGMPLLHKAVLHNSLEIVADILSEKPLDESIDNLFDQYRRTALHYAYASSGMKDIKKLLLTYGCSEHVLDKANKEPLDFRDRQDTEPMEEFLNRLKTHHKPECDPWSLDILTEDCGNASESDTESLYSNEEEEESRSLCSIS